MVKQDETKYLQKHALRLGPCSWSGSVPASVFSLEGNWTLSLRRPIYARPPMGLELLGKGSRPRLIPHFTNMIPEA